MASPDTSRQRWSDHGRVLRGSLLTCSGWDQRISIERSAFRDKIPPDVRYNDHTRR